MQTFTVEIEYLEIGEIEEDVLFAKSLTDALNYLDEQYLTIHFENTTHPSALVLKDHGSGEELARLATHFDAVSER